MIRLAAPEVALPGELVDARGGFAWWYVDLVDAKGDGVVVIFAFGLPFLPGYAGADRRGAPERAGDRPSVNVVVYRNGHPSFYLLQEDADAVWEAGDEKVRIGRSTLSSWREGAARRCEIVLDCEVPGVAERLRGTLSLGGPAVQLAPSVGDGPHQWSPLLTAAPGAVRLFLGEKSLLSTSGRAYHDRNGSTQALHRLGIAHWLWGRCPFVGGEGIFYLLWPEHGGDPVCWWIEVDLNGEARRVNASSVAPIWGGRGMFGLDRWLGAVLQLPDGRRVTVTMEKVLEDGPFYQRYRARVIGPDGEEAVGVAEAVRPDRVDLALMRPLVRMAVHRARGPNSWWLPLFSGEHADRWRRLWRWWTGRERAPAVQEAH